MSDEWTGPFPENVETTRRWMVDRKKIAKRSRPSTLELVEGSGAPKLFMLDQDKMIIGRESDVELRIQSPELSRRHLQLTRAHGEYTLVDLESRNGAYLNGIRVHSAVLRDGDQLQLGDMVFIYRTGA